MSTKDEYDSKMQANLDELNVEIDAMAANAEQIEVVARTAYSKQIEELPSQQDEARSKHLSHRPLKLLSFIFFWVAATSLFPLSYVNAALVDAGNGLINDTDLNITWSQDANLFKTQADNYIGGPGAFVSAVINSVGGVVHDTINRYDTPPFSGTYNLKPTDFDVQSGLMNWFGAQAWAGYLNSIRYGGYTGWRLPKTNDQYPWFRCLSELWHLYCFAGDNHPFKNILLAYWSSTEVGIRPGTSYDIYLAWSFSFYVGSNAAEEKLLWPLGAWAVRDGQVPVRPALTVSKTGSGSGTVTSSPAGINCGADCSENYATGTSVTLTATPASGYTFVGWGGACSGMNSTCAVTMNAAQTVTAAFSQSLSNGVEVNSLSDSEGGKKYFAIALPAGSTNMTITTAGGTGDADLYVSKGVLPTLSAYDCRSWVPGNSETCTFSTPTAGTYLVMIQAYKDYSGVSLMAQYTPPIPTSYLLTVASSGLGTVTSSPAGIDCGADCSESYSPGSSVTLTAEPAAGYSFIGWGGACNGASATCTVSMTKDQNVEATFVWLQRSSWKRALFH